MLKKTRRALHERIASVIEEQFSNTVQTEPEILAHHYTGANLMEPASKYWLSAGIRAMERSTDSEAVGHLNNALSALETLSESPERDRREIQIQIGLFRSLTQTEGWGSKTARESHERIRVLGGGTGDVEATLTVLVGDRIRHWTRAEYPQALELADKLGALADAAQNVDQHAFAVLMRVWPAMALGQVAELPDAARNIIENYAVERQEAFTARYGLDLKATAWAMLAYHRMLCTTREAAVEAIQESVKWARRINHVGTLKWVLFWGAAQPAAMLGDVALAETFAAELRNMPKKRLSPLDEAWGRFLAGWVAAKQGKQERGIEMMLGGESYLWREQVKMFRSVRLALLADVYLECQELAKAHETLEQASEHIATTRERVWESEIHRVRGNVLLAERRTERANECFKRAVRIAEELGLAVLRNRAEADLAKSC